MYTSCPFCKQKYDIEQEHIGTSLKCTVCGTAFVIKIASKKNNRTAPVPVCEKTTLPLKEYKVIKLDDKFITGEVNIELLEKVLNEHAIQGWRVVSSVTAPMALKYEEIVVILERDR